MNTGDRSKNNYLSFFFYLSFFPPDHRSYKVCAVFSFRHETRLSAQAGGKIKKKSDLFFLHMLIIIP